MPATATPNAQTSKRRVVVKKESQYGVLAGASGGWVARRTSLNLPLTKPPIESQEKRTDFQRADVRHGARMVDGNLDSELIAGVFAEFWAALCRRDFAATSTITFSSGDGVTISSGVVTRAAGGSESFITDGVRVGKVVRFADLSASGNNARNFLVTAVTATTMTLAVIDGGAAIADIGSADEACTLTFPGKSTFVPTSSHTSDSFNIEDYFSDTDLCDVSLGCRIVGCSIRVQPNGMVTVSWRIMGQDQVTRETGEAPYFTSPTAAGTDNVLESSLGYIRLFGAQVAVITGINIDIDLGGAATPVVGASVSPDVFYGRAFVARGQIQAYVQSNAYKTAFQNETEGEVFLMFQEPDSEPRDFISIFMGRAKLMSANKDDPDTVITQTLDFEALLKAPATGYESTTFSVQDSKVA